MTCRVQMCQISWNLVEGDPTNLWSRLITKDGVLFYALPTNLTTNDKLHSVPMCDRILTFVFRAIERKLSINYLVRIAETKTLISTVS